MNTRQLFFEHITQTSDSPLGIEISKADKCWLYDTTQNKKYLDLISGIAVANLGHNNKKIKKAINSQLDKYMHLMVYGELIQSPQVLLAAYLTKLLPPSLSTIYYTNSGAEAVEGALKLAKRYTGRTEFISFHKAYHGSTAGALSLGNVEQMKNAFRPLVPDNKILTYNNFNQIDEITSKSAAVIIEPVQAEAGVILPEKNYLNQIRRRCNETNSLLIFDECQTGFGRTGKLFAFQKFEVVPDVLCLGKAFGGGMPLGGFVASKSIMQSFISNPALGHLTTFGGHPVSCAAALAALEIIEEKKIYSSVNRKAKLFASLLKHPHIKQVRCAGLLIAVEFASAEMNKKVNKKLLQENLFVDWFLYAPHCLRIAPPLILSKEEITFACETLIKVLNTIS
jgi:acetylornithine/succinyldiaminopimelate/putrescine aminotransferase